jgi:putative Holliday junction resolvase
VRVLGIDLGLRRIGFALSDASGLLASPWKTIESTGGSDGDAARIGEAIAELEAGGEGPLQAVVIGHPRRLDGSATGLTRHAEAVAAALRARVATPVVLQDERLTSREAEERLAAREKDWRRRKAKLDAAAAAVLLQDYLDGLPPGRSGSTGDHTV